MTEKIKSAPLFIFCLISLLVATVISYMPSIDVPFYLDDSGSIVENRRVQAESLQPLINGPDRMRIVGYASLWVNYQISGLDVGSYHWVNLAIHIINGLLVFWLALIILRTFSVKTQDANRWWALLIATLWLLHPLNSQSVIYIVQRLASIAALFYLLTAISYIRLRQSDSIIKRLVYGAVLLFCLVAGLHSKQNYVCVFIFLFIWELFTASPIVRHYLLRMTVFGVVALCLITPFISEFWQALDKFTRDPLSDSRTSYFYTQTLVLWDYYWRFVLPTNLQLEIYVPLKKTMDAGVGFALLAHLLVMGLSIYWRRVIPLLFVGVMFFYTSHMVESFIIPIKDLAFEHRTYIGNIGLVIALVGVLKYLYDNQKFKLSAKVLAFTAGVVVIAYGGLIYQRATLWQDPFAFYANEVTMSPDHARANFSYGFELMIREKPAQAEPYLKKSFEIGMRNKKVTISGINTYMTVLYQQGKYQQAAQMAMVGLTHIKYGPDRSLLLGNIAYGYIKMGICDFAVGLLRTAIKLNPENQQAKNNLKACIKE